MLESLARWLFDPAGLTPHGFCLAWEPSIIWLYALGNIGVAIAYLWIPLQLAWLIRARWADLRQFRPVLALFAAFISLCGITHTVALTTLWWPAYGLEASLMAITGAVSLATAWVLRRLMPAAIALPSPSALEAALSAARDSAALLRAKYEGTPFPLHALDLDGRIVDVSDRWLSLLGYTARTEVLGRHIGEFQEDGGVQAKADWARLMETGDVVDAERRFVRRDGEVLDVLTSLHVVPAADGTPRRIVGALVDVTARKRAEAALQETEDKLRQTQRMEALGQLAGGVAHDFNNVLQSIEGGARLILRRSGDPAQVERLARMVLDAADRGASVSRRLLGVARKGELRAEAVPPGDMLAGLREVLTLTVGANITVRAETAAGLPALFADRGQLETSLVNLALNARDAMAASGGTLTLAATAERIFEGGALAPGQYVRLSVADTGAGMSPEVLARATEPFFTTKPRGEGTGLGLAMAKGLAEQSGGALRIESRQGQGTVVTLWLPVAPGAAPAPPPLPLPAPEEPVPVGAAATTKTPRVLLVDDEPVVRETMAEGLVDLGWRVVTAEDAAQALRALHGGLAPDILITDLAMPGMDGLALICAAREIRPNLPALLVTGHAGDIMPGPHAAAAGSGPFEVMRKPVSLEDVDARAMALVEATHESSGAVVISLASRTASGA